jgi:hypothetical protein
LFDRETGLIAALFYSVFQSWGTWKNLSADGEMLMNLPIIWAWAIAFRNNSLRARPELFVAGALLAAASLLKQPAAIAAVPLGIYLILPSYRGNRGLTLSNSIIQAMIFALGFLAGVGLVAIVLWHQGILDDAVYWTMAGNDVPHMFWEKGIVTSLAFLGACLPLVIGVVMTRHRESEIWTGRAPEGAALLGLLAVSALGAAAGARFYPHYYVQLIPPLALLAAPYYAKLWSGKIPPPYWLVRPKVTYAWLALTVIIFSIIHWTGLAPLREASEAGSYLFAHSNPEDRIFVWGQNAKIYLHAHRRPACRYITSFPLTGHIFGGLVPGISTRSRILPRAWSNLQLDFVRHPPAYIVDTEADPKTAERPVKDFPILVELLNGRCKVAARTAEGVIYRIR